jgi:hypothetical protein
MKGLSCIHNQIGSSYNWPWSHFSLLFK